MKIFTLIGTNYVSQSYFAKATQKWMFVIFFFAVHLLLNPLMPIICCTYLKYSAANARIFKTLNCSKKTHVQTLEQAGL